MLYSVEIQRRQVLGVEAPSERQAALKAEAMYPDHEAKFIGEGASRRKIHGRCCGCNTLVIEPHSHSFDRDGALFCGECLAEVLDTVEPETD